MAAPQVVEQISREAPELEAYKLGLLKLAKERADIPVSIPQIQAAGLSPQQMQAVGMAQQGLGSYLPYLNQANSVFQQAGGLFAGIPAYGAGAINALTGGVNYANQQAQQGLSAAQYGSNLGLGYGQNAIGSVAGGADYATGQAEAGLGNIASGVNLGQQYGQGALSTAQQAAGGAQQFSGMGYGDAARAAGLAMGSSLAGAQAYDPNAVSAFMNPYQREATQATLAEIRRQGDIARNTANAQAVRAGAFGGSREGVQRAELERNVLDQQARTMAQDTAMNYAQAQQAALNAFQNQQARMQQAGQTALGAGQLQTGAAGQAAQTALQGGQLAGNMGFNVGQLAQQGGTALGQAGLQAGQLGLQSGTALGQANLNTGQMAQNMAQLLGNLGINAGQLGLQGGTALGQANVSAGQLQGAAGQGIGQLGTSLANLGSQYQALGQGDTSFLYNIGGQMQQQAQRELDAQRQTALQQQYEPFQRISFLSDIYRGAPSTQQTISQSTAPSASPLSQAVGTGIAALGGVAALNKSGMLGSGT
jgi:hypothetical protein